MADTGTRVTPISPYDVPRRQLSESELISEEPVEGKTSENLDKNNEICEDQNKEDGNKEKENELPETNEEDDDENEKKDTEKPLLDDKESVKIDILPDNEDDKESVKIDILPDNEGEDTPTLPLPDKKRKSKETLEIDDKQKSKLPKYLFPLTRIKKAWNDSPNVFQFLGQVVCIFFQTVGWLTCVGGIPFLSLVMLIIGSIYVHDCNIQPKIPVYLIVSGVFGTIQHFIVIWTKYIPKESKGRLKVYRSYCRVINGLFHMFLLIMFILGCIWVYSVHSEVDFRDPEKDEYCNKTLYSFAFWMFNLSFFLLGLLLVLSLCFLVCAVATE